MRYWATVAIVAFLFIDPMPAFAQTAGNTANEPGLLQQISWAIGIPATLIGAAYSWVLISKTRAETKKANVDTEKATAEIAKVMLEREKLQRELNSSDPNVRESSVNLTNSINDRTAELISNLNQRSARNQTANSLLLRFVVLGLFQSFANALLNPAVIVSTAIVSYARRTMPGTGTIVWEVAVYLPPTVILAVQTVILLTIGLPLFRDLNRFLGIEMPRLSFRRRSISADAKNS